jgi:glycosyltransferase involved in cell wall biosynthesis
MIHGPPPRGFIDAAAVIAGPTVRALTLRDAGLAGRRVALVHDYLVMTGGAERTFSAIAQLFPEAPIFTAVYRRETAMSEFQARDVRPLWSDRIPVDARTYRGAFAAYALAFEGLRLEEFDLVISSSSGFAKSAGSRARARVCYCHTPPRFLWPSGVSSKRAGPFERIASGSLRIPLRRLDRAAARRIDHFVANSDQTRQRIKRYYDRGSEVVHPPVDVERFQPTGGARTHYLTVGRLVPYKGFDVAVRTCTLTNRPLVVVGDGREMARLRAMAGPTISFAGPVSDEDLVRLYSTAHALLLPGEDDWGMTCAEANACGCPVVAAARGGSLESVIDGVNGVLYSPDGMDGLADALDRFETLGICADTVRDHAMQFREEEFLRRMLSILAAAVPA